MARPSGPSRDETPSASCGSVNEVSAEGNIKRPDPVTRVGQPVSRRVVCSSRSRDLIHRSRQAGWGLARCWSVRLSRRPASPIRTRRMGSGQSCGRTVATNLKVCRSNNRNGRTDSLGDRSGGFLDTTGQRPIPRPCVAVKCGQALRNASDPTDLVSVVKEVCG